MAYNEEEFQHFVKQNRSLIEQMMNLQREAAASALQTGRTITHEVADTAKETMDSARAKTEEFVSTTYNMFTDPQVQKHFMTMGMEFMMAVTAMMQNAPTPDFMKESVEDVGRTWKRTSCSMNDECEARKPSKVTIEPDDGRRKVTFDDMDD